MSARGRGRGGEGWEKEGDRQPSAASASVTLFISGPLSPTFSHSSRPSCGPRSARPPLFRLPFFPPVSPRNEKERHGYFNENPARLCRHLVSSPPPPPPLPRSRATTAVARLMNALCKYYFCLCTRQLSATLVLINNAKQSAGATGSWRRSLPA